VLHEKNHVLAAIWRLLYSRTAVQLTVIEGLVFCVPSLLLSENQAIYSYVFGLIGKKPASLAIIGYKPRLRCHDLVTTFDKTLAKEAFQNVRQII
jgi:hypothetical protein